MKKPHILRAIPKRRYELENFSVVVLDEIESDDPQDYRYIMALVEAGQNEPMMYIIVEKNPPENRQYGLYQARVLLGEDERLLGSDDFLGDLNQFTEYGLIVAARLLHLTEEEPIRLM